MKTSAAAVVMVVLVALAVLTSACTLGGSEGITGNAAKESGAGQGLEADAADVNTSIGGGNVNDNGDADFCNFGLGVLRENSPKL